MIPVGYMAKLVSLKPEWLKNDKIVDIYSVSSCTSHDFDDYINYWKHNGYWLFNSPQIIKNIAQEHNTDLKDIKFFYYEAYEYQYYEDDPNWEIYEPEISFETKIVIPDKKILEGYDIVSFSSNTSPECSYFSCNHMAETINVNQHCLLETFDEAKFLLENKAFKDCEPGPCRIFAVYSLPDV